MTHTDSTVDHDADTAIADAGDFVRVATGATPTEAHLLKNVLSAAGLSPQVADANTAQGNPFMAPALGGVRVLVPETQVGAARAALAAYHAGSFELADDDAIKPAPFAPQPAPLFSADMAALLSFPLTPVFGAAIQLINRRTMGTKEGALGQWISLIVLAIASVFAVIAMHELAPGPFVIFRANALIGTFTVLWYFIIGQTQSRAVIAKYGPRYRRKSLAPAALGTAAAWLAAGFALSELA